mgnify:CR=1 FL=1
MTSRLTPDEVLAFLLQVESGTITLTTEREPQLIYAGQVRYQASNGWVVSIFNDCGSWDYVEEIVVKDDEVFSFADIPSEHPLYAYEPSDEIAWMRWQFPGPMHFKCRRCGTEIRPPGWCALETLCVTCGGKADLPHLPCKACGRDTVPDAKLIEGVCEICQFEQQVQQQKKEGSCQ